VSETRGPPQRPFDAIMLNVGDGHWLYVEQCGRSDGIPVVFLHGGPGSGSQHAHRDLFDPNRFHAFLFDQRGAGRSHPFLSCTANTMAHQIADIERIRNHFGIERWIVVGGSWGSTLGLAYAEHHPERVAGLVLRAIFLGTDEEIQWAFVDGPQRFRPELYKAFLHELPVAERDDPLRAYVARLRDSDPAIFGPAAQVWNAYERALSELLPASTGLPDRTAAKTGRIAPTPILEAHYIAHSFFMKPGQLLDEAWRLSGIPGVLIQGRYDLLCPPAAAEAVATAWGNQCRLRYIERAGHAMTEPGIFEALREGVNNIADQTFGR
jgi:proline iminopeptidase